MQLDVQILLPKALAGPADAPPALVAVRVAVRRQAMFPIVPPSARVKASGHLQLANFPRMTRQMSTLLMLTLEALSLRLKNQEGVLLSLYRSCHAVACGW
jgi:hypothetical protein